MNSNIYYYWIKLKSLILELLFHFSPSWDLKSIYATTNFIGITCFIPLNFREMSFYWSVLLSRSQIQRYCPLVETKIVRPIFRRRCIRPKRILKPLLVNLIEIFHCWMIHDGHLSEMWDPSIDILQTLAQEWLKVYHLMIATHSVLMFVQQFEL